MLVWCSINISYYNHQCWKTVVLLNVLVETILFVHVSLMNNKFKRKKDCSYTFEQLQVKSCLMVAIGCLYKPMIDLSKSLHC